VLGFINEMCLAFFGVSLEGRLYGWLTKLPMQAVGDTFQSVPIFVRYTLTKFEAKSGWRGFLSRLIKRRKIHALYLHEFFRSDKDRCPHDHPWAFVTVILKGGYWEHTSTGKHWRRAGSVLYRPAEFAHSIELEPGTKPWSLVLVWEKSRDWGFYTPKGWEKWTPGYSPICELE
jgi:hypothetical protein